MNLYQSTTCTANSHIYELKRRQFHSKKIIIISSLFDNYCFFFSLLVIGDLSVSLPKKIAEQLVLYKYLWLTGFGTWCRIPCEGRACVIICYPMFHYVLLSKRRLCHYILPYVSLCPIFEWISRKVCHHISPCVLVSKWRLCHYMLPYVSLCPSNGFQESLSPLPLLLKWYYIPFNYVRKNIANLHSW